MAIKMNRFPKEDGLVRGIWAPVFLAPSETSPERLVIGVVATANGTFHVERANRLDKLKCLFGKEGSAARFAADAVLDELQHLAETRGLDVSGGRFLFSNVEIGAPVESEASSCQAMARMWMRSMSSLYGEPSEMQNQVAAPAKVSQDIDNVPVAIFDAVVSMDPTLEGFFNDGIREKRPRRRGASVVGVDIDFAGDHLVANFDGLYATTRASSVDRIKRKIFDLIVERDERDDKKYEMFVYAPLLDNPAATKRQTNSIEEAIWELKEQSEHEGIGFEAQNRMLPIVERVAELEAA